MTPSTFYSYPPSPVIEMDWTSSSHRLKYSAKAICLYHNGRIILKRIIKIQNVKIHVTQDMEQGRTLETLVISLWLPKQGRFDY
jgi:hypothetical protein